MVGKYSYKIGRSMSPQFKVILLGMNSTVGTCRHHGISNSSERSCQICPMLQTRNKQGNML